MEPSNAIYLIRHGDYKRSSAGDQHQHLVESGRKQAKSTGSFLKDLIASPSNVYVSTMTRAKETAALITEHMGDCTSVEYSDLFREISLSVPLGEVTVSVLVIVPP